MILNYLVYGNIKKFSMCFLSVFSVQFALKGKVASKARRTGVRVLENGVWKNHLAVRLFSCKKVCIIKI